MTLPILSVSPAPANGGAGRAAAEPQETHPSSSFSSVLTERNRAVGRQATPSSEQDAQTSAGQSTTMPAKEDTSAAKGSIAESNEPTTADGLAGGQAGLPAIALDIAMQTAAVLERTQPSRTTQTDVAADAPSRLFANGRIQAEERRHSTSDTGFKGNAAPFAAASAVSGRSIASDRTNLQLDDVRQSDALRQRANAETGRLASPSHADSARGLLTENQPSPFATARKAGLQAGREQSNLGDTRQGIRTDPTQGRPNLRAEASFSATDPASRFAAHQGDFSYAARPDAASSSSAASSAHHSSETITVEYGLAASVAGGSTTHGGITASQALAGAVPLPLHHPQWSQAFGQQFVHLAQSGRHGPQIAELRLDPPDLGPLRISIQISDNVAHAVFVSAHANVRQTVENALPQLQEQLAQAGISLGQTSVSDQGAPGREFQADNATRGPSMASGDFGSQDAAPTMAAPVQRTIAANALVDTFA